MRFIVTVLRHVCGVDDATTAARHLRDAAWLVCMRLLRVRGRASPGDQLEHVHKQTRTSGTGQVLPYHTAHTCMYL